VDESCSAIGLSLYAFEGVEEPLKARRISLVAPSSRNNGAQWHARALPVLESLPDAHYVDDKYLKHWNRKL
jgi:hypothetical protein